MNEIQIEKLKALPQRPEETWQGGLIPMRAWITGKGPEPDRPYIPMWVAVRDDKVQGGELLRPHERNFQAAIETLIAFACDDQIGGYCPGRVEVGDPALAEHLGGLLAEVGVEVRVVERLEAVERVLDGMDAFGGENARPVPGPLEGKGVTVERMRPFAEAAAAFYRAALWHHLSDVDLIRVEEPKCPPGMEYAIVLGAGRTAYGLGFYRSVPDYAKFRRGAGDPAKHSLGSLGVWQLSFDPILEIPPGDGDLWESHGLAVADEKAYPVAACYGPRDQLTRAGMRELTFLEGLLWALAETSEAEIDSGRWQKEVTTYDGATRVTLSIPDLLKPPSFQEWLKRGFEPDRRSHERMFADMGRYFRDHPPADMDEMNAAAQQLFTGKKIDELVTSPETPLEKAQELCYEAFGTYGRRRVQLAREALDTCPDCADAYVILAEQAGSLEAEIDYYAKGVAAGEQALGPKTFDSDLGHFWGVTATRPYMRVRFGLAQTLEQLGRTEEAVEHYQELLRLNPNDNQGVRYSLMPRLMELRKDGEAARLLKAYEEKSTNWVYARALLAFRLGGKSIAARRELREALRTNPLVVQYLQEEGPLPMPPHYSPGSPEEAIICAEELLPAFEKTDGALEWLASEHRQWEKEVASRRKQQRRKERQRRKKRKR